MNKLKILISLLLLFFIFALPIKINAQNQSGITVSPSIIHLDLSKDLPEYNLTYRNNTNYTVELSLSVEDFKSLEGNYQIDFLDKKDASTYKYSLSSWVKFETNNISLSAFEEKTIKVFIDKQKITKGGHYASILAKINQPQEAKKVNLNAILASLVFVRASTGQEIEDGLIQNFKPERDLLDLPNSYILQFENKGNVHLIPYGIVEVFDPLNTLVAKGVLNENSLDALPESIRRYDIKVNRLQKILLPGQYKAKISIHFGKTDKKLSKTISFFSFGGLDLVKIGFILIIILILIFAAKKYQKKS